MNPGSAERVDQEQQQAQRRCLFILADLEPGGAQRVILTVLRHLDPEVFDPYLAVVDSMGPMAIDIPREVEVHRLGGSRVRYSLPALYLVIRKLRPQVVVSTLGHLNLALLATRELLPQSTRLLVREANTPSVRLKQTSHPRLYQWAYQRLYPLADRVICNASFMKDDLVERFSIPPEKIAIIPNPVDRERIGVRLAGKKNPYQVGEVRLVSVGRLNRQKGVDLLLRAMQEVSNDLPELRLTVVGAGEERKALEVLTRQLGLDRVVTFVGHQDNPYPFMAHADLFVSSSRYEGSPNAVLESLACGTPVLAFDCPGGTREIITEGRNGWLVPAEDTRAMAAKLVEVVRNRAWETMDSRNLLPEAFECGNAVKAYEDVLLETAR